MKIGINALYLLPGEVGGTEIYLRSLLPALVRIAPQHEFVVFLNRETYPLRDPGLESVRQVCCGIRAANRPVRIAYEQTILPFLLARHGIDVLLNAGFTAPVLSPCPMLTAIHDLQHKSHPEFFRRLDLPFWNLLVWAAVRRSRMILTFSTRTALDLTRIYSVPPARIAVAPHGVDPELFSLNNPDRRSSRMILTVSTLHPHKNLDRLLRAFAKFHTQHPGHRLVIAGLRGFASEELEHLCEELDLTQSVTLTGWIPRTELYALFQAAGAFIYPSLFEGFGLPVLEALAAGIPAACSAIDPLIEIAGGTALTFDPSSVEAITDALERLQTFDGSAGPAQARLYSWEQSARATLAALEAAAS